MMIRLRHASYLLLLLLLAPIASANIVFPVQSKFKGRERSLTALRTHDTRRHGRLILSINLDLPLGGNGDPADTGLYFAKIRIGTPPKDHYVQVDTGSDILWINCAGCDTCPSKTDIGDDSWCIGWQTSVMQSKDGDDIALLGDLSLSNKLVLYDVENESLGWVEYNCSSSIKVKDKSSGAVYTVGAHELSLASTVMISEAILVIFFFCITALLQNGMF